jgi:hypothetical protein
MKLFLVKVREALRDVLARKWLCRERGFCRGDFVAEACFWRHNWSSGDQLCRGEHVFRDNIEKLGKVERGTLFWLIPGAQREHRVDSVRSRREAVELSKSGASKALGSRRSTPGLATASQRSSIPTSRALRTQRIFSVRLFTLHCSS